MSAAAMAPVGVSFRVGVLPWALSPDDRRRFRRILQHVLAATAAFALVMPWLPVSPPSPAPATQAPLPVARLLIPRNDAATPQPARPPMPPKPAAAPVEPPSAKAARQQPPKPQPPSAREREGQVAQARHPKPNRPPGEDLSDVRRRASGVGLLAAKEQLASLHAAPVAVQLRQDVRPGPGVGTGSGPGVGAGSEAGLPLRAIITAGAARGSGGINTAAYSRNSGGGGLAGRSTTLVEGAIGGGGGGGAGGGAGAGTGLGRSGDGSGGPGAGRGGTVQKGAGARASRSIEDIRLVFERHKGAIHALYQRALREDATLQGKIVVELRIAPSGEVTAVRVVSSELKTPDLEGKLLARIRQFDFGTKDVDAMVVTWPVDFLPS